MFKIQNKTIHISRTESGILKVKRTNGSISEIGDANSLRIYEVDSLDEGYLVDIPGEYNSTDDTIDFNLGLFTVSYEDIELSNEPIEYWYELRINDKIIIGYDESKAKTLILYPAGKDKAITSE